MNFLFVLFLAGDLLGLFECSLLVSRDLKGLQIQKILDVFFVFPWFFEQTKEKKEIKQLLPHGAHQARPYIVVGRFYSVGTETNEIFAAFEDYPEMYSMDIMRTQVSLAKLFAGADLSALFPGLQLSWEPKSIRNSQKGALEKGYLHNFVRNSL